MKAGASLFFKHKYLDIPNKIFPISAFSHSEKVICKNQAKVLKKLLKIQSDPEKLDIVADFDNTITSNSYFDQKVQASFSVFYQSNFVSQDYKQKGQQLFTKYHQYEIDPSINNQRKYKLMQEWWIKTYEIIRDENIGKEQFTNIINNSLIAYRYGFPSFFEFCKQKNFNFFVVSGGVQDIIHYVLKQLNYEQYSKLKILSNKMIFENERIKWFDDTFIVHSKNKSEILNRNNKAYNLGRFCFLFGDAVHDLDMVKNAKYEEQISFCFINPDAGIQSREECINKYDIVIDNNGSFEFATHILSQIFNRKLSLHKQNILDIYNLDEEQSDFQHVC